ncbi:class I SAM-dependent methyltransferase [Streptomyces sp. NPDC046862]|uniref:class I SAM-dependent methyltransferase n=1 Tax=Streptomyces sp. NPDC046862 TaxID=3154603 RepID=UPI0034559142
MLVVTDDTDKTGPDPADDDRISKACATLGHGDDLRDRAGTAPARILELGAGIVATTDDLLPQLAATGIKLRYVYNDISPEFLKAGGERFPAHPFVEFELLDIKRRSGLAAPPADVLLSANVLHNAHDVGATLTQLRRMTADRRCSCCRPPRRNPGLARPTSGPPRTAFCSPPQSGTSNCVWPASPQKPQFRTEGGPAAVLKQHLYVATPGTAA